MGACLTVGLVPLLLQRLDWRHSAAQPETDGQQEVRRMGCDVSVVVVVVKEWWSGGGGVVVE